MTFKLPHPLPRLCICLVCTERRCMHRNACREGRDHAPAGGVGPAPYPTLWPEPAGAYITASMDRHGAQRSLPPAGGGKEELRAGLLVPYLLRLRDERGEAAARALLSKAGIPTSILEDENAWISVAAARRALNALATALDRKSTRLNSSHVKISYAV